MTECPPGYSEFRPRLLRQEPLTPQMLTPAANFLQQHSGANDSIFVFPYQTMFGLASRRNVAGGLMQAYTASGPILSQLEIAGLEGTPIPAALYLPDADLESLVGRPKFARWSRNYLSVPVDGIPNFTRIPEVWFWMLRHYRTAKQLTPGVVGLRARRLARIAHRDAVAVARPAGQDLCRSTIAHARPPISARPSGRPDSTFCACGLPCIIRCGGSCASPSVCNWRSAAPTASRDLQWMVVPPECFHRGLVLSLGSARPGGLLQRRPEASGG